MKTIQIKSTNKRVYVISLLILAFLALAGGLFFLPYIIRNLNAGNAGKIVAIGIGIAFFVVAVLLKKVLQRKYIIQIDEYNLTIQQGSRTLSTPLDNIVLLKQKSSNLANQLTIFTKGPTNVFVQLDSIKPEPIQELIDELKRHGKYVTNFKSSSMGDAWIEHINTSVIQADANALPQVRTAANRRKKIGVLIGVLGILALMGLPIALLFVNPKAFYETRDGKIYYGKMEMVGVNPDSCRQIDYNVLKDSSHIYYKGHVLEWADRATFRKLEHIFFADKNGVYYETTNLFSKNTIRPLDGDYDKATFHALGNGFFFKDKNHVYHMELNALDNKVPLRKIDVEGLDVESFEELAYNWAADKQMIYFTTWDHVRPCKEIDRKSFEVIDGRVAKDKNHVYYLTRDLKSEGNKATHNENYAILKGAHAPTFVATGHETYEDKNTEWSIGREGEEEEEEPEVNYRDDVE